MEVCELEKFTYLKGFLSIQGLKLTAKNYKHACLQPCWFGNKQGIISKHMENLLNLDRVTNSNNVKVLRNIYDQITVDLRGLFSFEIKSKQFEPMLVPISTQKVPETIRLELSKKVNESSWGIDEVIKVLRDEIEAR